MRLALHAAFCAAVVATIPAAYAQSYTLDTIEIHGVKSVPADTLRAGLVNHTGDKVTTADLLANQDALTKELQAQHVTGGVKTSLRNKQHGHIDLIFDVDDQGVVATKVQTVAPKLGAQTFVGNVKLSADDLVAATGLKANDELSDAKIQAAETAIGDAYKKKKLGVKVSGVVRQAGGKADLVWTIIEQKAPAKKANPGDEGGYGTE